MTDDLDRDPEMCPKCGSYRDWEDCGECGGDGYINRYDEDPLWYDEDDESPCDLCGSHGGWYVCHECVAAREEST